MQEMLKSTINSNKAFRSCGLMPEDKELIDELDNCRHENEEIPEALPLESLSAEDRIDEFWVDEFIRVFSDGSVDHPADFLFHGQVPESSSAKTTPTTQPIRCTGSPSTATELSCRRSPSSCKAPSSGRPKSGLRSTTRPSSRTST